MVSQYLLSRGNPQAARNDWPILIALNSLLWCSVVLTLVIEPNKEAALQTLWLAILCLACSYAGASLASLHARNVRKTRDRGTFRAMSPASCRRLLLAGAAVVAAVAIVLVVGVIPLTARAGTFPDGTPGSTVPVFWGIAGLNALVAACLGFFGFRVSGDNRAPYGALAVLALLAFMSACGLAPAAFAFRGHGPVLLTVSKLALLCMVAEIVVTAFVGCTALRLSEARAA